MKKTLSILLIAILVTPAFAAWLPHDVIYSLHKNNLEHYVIGSHSHSNHQHSHEHPQPKHSLQDTDLSQHHPVHFDITTYFSDTLNAELHRTSQNSPDYNALELFDIDFSLVTFIKPRHHYYLFPSKNRIPLHWKIFSTSPIPLYLATARLRI
jgi:hypothetical protein